MNTELIDTARQLTDALLAAAAVRRVGVPRISLAAYRELVQTADSLTVRSELQDEPKFRQTAFEVMQVARAASRGMCLGCGAYDGCGCDPIAQTTLGY